MGSVCHGALFSLVSVRLCMGHDIDVNRTLYIAFKQVEYTVSKMASKM